MRLSCLENGHTREQKEFLDAVSQATGSDAPSVVKVIKYRPEFFGTAFSTLAHEALRGGSEWSAGERELFAGFVSRVNQCPF